MYGITNGELAAMQSERSLRGEIRRLESRLQALEEKVRLLELKDVRLK